MKYSELSARYAKAIFDASSEQGVQEKVFADLRALRDILMKDDEFLAFIESPLVSPEHKEQAFLAALKDAGLCDTVKDFVLLLAKKDRLALFNEIVEAFQVQADAVHGVTRGEVRSTTMLSPQERSQIETIVAKVTGKQVILSYSEDPSLLGGLVAEVGSYTFDDALTSHLNRIKDELNRRAH